MRRNLRTGWIPALVLIAGAALPVQAAIFLEASPPIPGEATTPGFENQIQVDSVQWGGGVAVNCAGSSAPSWSELTISLTTSIASVPFIQAVRDNTAYSTFTLRYTKDVGGTEVVYQTITLNSAIVSGYSQSSGGDSPSESVSINFQSATVTYIQLDGGKSMGTNTVTFSTCS